MKVWALTGGIGSGKSTVAGMFAERGASTLSADANYHALLAPRHGTPSALAREVHAALGATVAPLLPDGALDRVTLGRAVFGDDELRRRLEAIVHPAIALATQAALERLREAGCAHALYDVPLLFEKKLQDGFAGTVLVWVPRPVQRARLVARDRCSNEAAEARLAAQMPLDDKRALARWVVDNQGTRENTQEQVTRVWQDMLRS